MTRIITVGPTGRDYTSLSPAISGTVTAYTDPVTDGQPWVFECDAFVDTNIGIVLGATIATTASLDLTINCASGYELTGSNTCLSFAGVDYAKIIGAKLSTSADQEARFPVQVSSGVRPEITRCTIERTATALGPAIRFASTTSGRLINCVVINGTDGLELLRPSVVDVYNNTFVNQSAYGISFGILNASHAVSTKIANNAVFSSRATASFEEGTNPPEVLQSNATWDALGDVTNITTAAFVDYASGDYTPAPGGALDGTGADLSADFTDDITGATRTTPWDIGAFSVVAAGGTTIDAVGGSFSLTGGDVSLTVQRQLSGNPGTFSLTGSDVNLTYAPVASFQLDANPGTFTFTGGEVLLTVQRALNADAGSYTLTGSDATLSYGRVFTADAGSFSLTGSDVSFSRGYAMSLEPGEFTLTGSTVSLSYSGEARVHTINGILITGATVNGI